MKYLKLMLVVYCLVMSLPVAAVAFCALRDPVASIESLFPQASHYKSIIRSIDMEQRQQLADSLEGISVHYGELGRHTLYEVYRDKVVIGYVHVRSEQSRWGLMEVVWALSPQLKVVDYSFQRVRSSHYKNLLEPEFKQHFIGKSFASIQSLWHKPQQSGSKGYLQSAGESQDLAVSLLKCGLKTLYLTQAVWGDRFGQPEQEQWRGRSELVGVNILLTEDEKESISRYTGINFSKTFVYRQYNSNNQTPHWQVNTRVLLSQSPENMRWLYHVDGQLQSAEILNESVDEGLRDIFLNLQGKSFTGSLHCANSAEMIAQGLWLAVQSSR